MSVAVDPEVRREMATRIMLALLPLHGATSTGELLIQSSLPPVCVRLADLLLAALAKDPQP